MTRSVPHVLVSLALVLLVAPAARAIDHEKDGFAVGYSSLQALQPTPLPLSGMPGLLSMRVAMSPKLELGGLLGLSRGDGVNGESSLNFYPGVRANYTLKAQENINLYAAGQLALGLTTNGPQSVFTTFFLGAGTEFRFSEFKNLSFFIDVGIAGFIADSFHFASTGSLLGNAGFHYWFGSGPKQQDRDDGKGDGKGEQKAEPKPDRRERDEL